jgi:hypothetical protein
MFDISQFSQHIIQAASLDHCGECGEVLDSFDRCGCDY